jgi:hypothetical protein
MLSLVVLSLVSTAAGAYAQSTVQGTVPFAFTVSGKQMPAGTYTVAQEMDRDVIAISNVQTGTSALVLVRKEPHGKTVDKLIFHHVNGQFFLTQIWGPAGFDGMTVPPSKREREIEVARVTPTAEKNVEIALK